MLMLVLGILIGVFLGITLMSTLAVGKKHDEVMEDTIAELAEKTP